MNSSTRDMNYVKIIRTRNRGKMYKYRLIKSIILDLDEYILQNNTVNEYMLMGTIERLYMKHSGNLIRYFNLFGRPFIKTISVTDIENWTYKYNWPRKLDYDDSG